MKEYIKNNDTRQKSIIDNQEYTEEVKQSINYNGFTNHPTLLQILPITYALLMTIQLAFIIDTSEKLAIKICVSIFYALVFLSCCVFWYLTTKIDPTDNVQIKHRNAKQKSQQFIASQYRHFCHICETCVSKNAFHCRKCNRCVEMFDHHCKWLNNCIGAKNYFEFFYLISSTEALLIYHIVVNCVDLSWIVKNYEQNQFEWLFYTEIIAIVLDFIIFCFNTVLFSMHIYLITQRKTTIQLIKEMRGQNKIHPSKKTQEQYSEKKEEPQCESAQDWKLSQTSQKNKIEELIIKKKTKAEVLLQSESTRKGKILEINSKNISTRLAPLKLVKYTSQR